MQTDSRSKMSELELKRDVPSLKDKAIGTIRAGPVIVKHNGKGQTSINGPRLG